MPLINWSEKLSVKIASIDNQHKKLIELINKLNDAMSQGKANEVMAGIFDDLIKYTVTHFTTEENYFEMHGYPSTAQHKKEHEDLKDKALALQKDFKSGKLTVSVTTMRFLKEWLENHIMSSDQAYSGFLIEKGIR